MPHQGPESRARHRRCPSGRRGCRPDSRSASPAGSHVHRGFSRPDRNGPRRCAACSRSVWWLLTPMSRPSAGLPASAPHRSRCRRRGSFARSRPGPRRCWRPSGRAWAISSPGTWPARWPFSVLSSNASCRCPGRSLAAIPQRRERRSARQAASQPHSRRRVGSSSALDVHSRASFSL